MKDALKSNRYMTRQQVADHYQVDKTTIRRPSFGSPFARLRQIKIGGVVRILRSDVEALDRQLERAAMTPYGQEPARMPEFDHTGEEDRAS
jgi:hypothetical protein